MQKIYITVIDEKTDSVRVFSHQSDALEHIIEHWHLMMKNFQFSRAELQDATEEFKNSRNTSYTIRDIDGNKHSAKILTSVLY